MCSPVSPTFARSGDALLAAVAEVAESSLFAFADTSDQDTFDAAVMVPLADGGATWLHACIGFNGSTAGRLTLTLSESLAHRLCVSFAGAETPDEIGDSDILDFTGELANMICGAWLTRAYSHEGFSLVPPRVGRGQSDSATPGDATAEEFYLAIDEAPIRLELHWTTAAPSSGEAADGR
jgi:CheY-specific phosphatase CheX